MRPSAPFSNSFWSSMPSLICHFLVAFASARHFLLVLRHLLWGPVFIACSWSSGSSSFATSLWSLRPRVTSSWPFVTPSWPHVAPADSRSQFPRFRHPGGPSWFLTGLRRRTLPRTLLIWPYLQVRPSCSDLPRFSVPVATMPLRNPIIPCCTPGPYALSRRRICIYRLVTRGFPPAFTPRYQ